MSGALLTIDLDALAANYHLLRSMSGGAETAPVVKADGYGTGGAQSRCGSGRKGPGPSM